MSFAVRPLKTLLIASLACTFIPLGLSAQDGTRPNAPNTTVPRVPRSPSKYLVPPKASKPLNQAVAKTPAPVVAQPLRVRIVTLLSGYEYFPTKQDLAKEGSDAQVSKELRALTKDTKTRSIIRTKAVDALGYYNDSQTRSVLGTLALTPVDVAKDRQGDSMRHHAIVSLAKSQQDDSVELLKPLLMDPDIQIRITTVVALGKHAQNAARPVLLERLAVEENQVVGKELQRYVRQAPASSLPEQPTQPVSPQEPETKEPVESSVQ